MKCVWMVVMVLGGVCLVGWARGDCTQTGPCSCESSDGTIDLSPLDGKGSPRFKDQRTSTADTYLYSWNPCSPFTELDNCKDVSGCQVASGLSYPLGTQDSATFKTDPSTQDLSLEYSASDPNTGDTRTLSVLLVCDPTAKPGTLNVIGQTVGLSYAMSLNSYYCCPGASHDDTGAGGLSVGSVLVILFFSLLLVYLVAGVLFMKFVRKADGKEVIPNYTVWTAVPGFIKDGALFTFRGACSLCGRRTSYDKI